MPPAAVPAKTRAQTLRSYRVADFPALTGREEEWRFTPLKRLRGLATAGDGTPVGVGPTYQPGQLPAGLSVMSGPPLEPASLTIFC